VCAVGRLSGTGAGCAAGAAGCTRFEVWASAASFAFSVRIRFRGPLTLSESIARGNDNTGCIESSYDKRMTIYCKADSMTCMDMIDVLLSQKAGDENLGRVRKAARLA
jgi:hypothetical protein